MFFVLCCSVLFCCVLFCFLFFFVLCCCFVLLFLCCCFCFLFLFFLGVCGRLPARPPPARLAAHRLDPGQGPASSHWNDWQNYSTWLRYSSKLDYSTRLLRSGWLRAPPPLDMPPLFGYTQCTQTAIFFAIALIWSLHLLAVREGKTPHPQWT